MLTDTQIRNAKASAKPAKISDGGGLYLQIEPNGSKLWRLKYRFAGKEKKLAIGAYPIVSLAEARKRRDRARELLAQGADPSEQKRLDKLRRAAQSANTFETVAREYIEKLEKEGKRFRTIKKARTLLSKTYTVLGHRPISEITAPELLDFMRKVESRGRSSVAGQLRAQCSLVFRYGIATGRAERDVAADLRGALVAHKATNRPAIIEPQEVGELLRAIDGYKGALETRLALKLLLLTAARPGELRSMEWAELDLEKARWIIPNAKTKMDKPHMVPLSRQALEMLKTLQTINGRGKYVFPSIRTPLRCMSDNTMNGALRRLGYAKTEVCSHGFRATASTLLNESGKWNRDVIERALAHSDKDAVRAAYNRAEYWEERVAMLQAWANMLDELAATVPMCLEE